MCYDKRGSVNNMEQFSRTISLVGQSAFDRVHQARVAVFGVGGVGGYVCEALVRSGIAEIDLFDRDDVSISNLNRQIIALHSTIGQDKVDAMAARLKDINPDVRVNCRKMFYLPTNADEIDLSVYDFVVDAVDTVAAKLELARRCEQGGIRFISTPKNIASMNRNTPILFISGDKDPVGEMGKGVKRAYEAFRRAGVRDVELKLYRGLRHEILNEDCRAVVYNDLWSWIEKHL